MNLLSVPINQKSDEYIPGYLTRLAFANGFSAIEELFRKTELFALIRGRGKKYQDACAKFHLSFPLQSPAIPLPKTTVRICPACILEQGYIKTDWHSLTAHHCEEHQLTLIDSCKDCHRPLQWDVQLFEAHCTNPYCGVALPWVPSNLSKDEHKLAYECYLAGEWCLNQLESTENTSPSIRLVQEIGYGFLKAPVTAEFYLNQFAHRASPGALPHRVVMHSLYELRAKLSDSWRTIEQLDAFLAKPLPITEPLSDSLLLSVRQFCQLSGFDRNDLNKLIDQDIVTSPEARYRIEPDSILNTAKLFKLFIDKSAPVEGAKPLAEWRDLIESFCQTFSAVLIMCVEGKIPFQYQPGELLLDSIWVTEHDVRNCLANQVDLMRDQIIRFEQIQKMTGLSPTAIKKAIRSGQLRPEAQTRFDYCHSLFLSEATTLMKMNMQQAPLPLWGE